MKNKIITGTLLSLTLAFVLGSAVAQEQGDDVLYPYVTIHSSGDVRRGETGSFVLAMKHGAPGTYVNFSVRGTAIPGIDYVPVASPARIGPSGYGTILIQTLPDPRGLAVPRSYSLVVTLEPGGPYTIGTPESARMMIRPAP